MKTLQEEVVEALFEAQQEINTLRYHAGLNGDDNKFNQMAARVESARCENCEHWKTDQDPDSGECIHKNNHNSELFDSKDAFSLNWADMEFGCWHFEQKVK